MQYTPNLTNAGVNPFHSTKKPSVLTLLAKQSLIDLYGALPFASIVIFCILDLITSKGFATMFATKEEHKVEQNIIGNP